MVGRKGVLSPQTQHELVDPCPTSAFPTSIYGDVVADSLAAQRGNAHNRVAHQKALKTREREREQNCRANPGSHIPSKEAWAVLRSISK